MAIYQTKKHVDKHVASLLGRLRDEGERNARGFQIARLYYGVKEYDTARKYLATYLYIKEKYAPAHKLMGQIHEGLGQFDKAVNSYKRSLDLDDTQKDLVLKICQLYCRLDIDPERARYWSDRAERLFPRHEIVFQLKEKILQSEGHGNAQDLENLVSEELIKRPKDVHLRIKLLQLYINTGRVNEAYHHAVEVEKKGVFNDSIAWYQHLVEVHQAYQAEGGRDSMLWVNYLGSLNTLVALRLKQSGVVDCAEALHSFDQCLNTAMNLKSKTDTLQVFLNQMQGQLFLQAGILLLKKAEKDQLGWKDAAQLAAACFLVSYSFNTPDLQGPWFATSPDERKRQYHQWYNKACYRLCQAGHMLKMLCKGDRSKWIKNVKQKDCTPQSQTKLVDLLFIIKDQQGQRSNSYLQQSSVFKDFTPKFPIDQQLNSYEAVVPLLHPNNLSDLVWIALQHFTIKDKTQPNYNFQLFDGLQYTTNSLETGNPETLCVLDTLAFLYAVVWCTSMKLSERGAVLLSDPNQPNLLPACLCGFLATTEQSDWWESAYRLFAGSAKEDFAKLRKILQRGLETIRLVGNHGVDILLVVHLARTFDERMKESKANGHTSLEFADEVRHLQARTVHYWKMALEMLDKVRRNLNPKQVKGLFPSFGSYLSDVEIQDLKAEGEFFLACEAMDSAHYENAVKSFEKLNTPYASYYQAKIYKRLAEDELSQSRDDVMTPEMQHQYTALMTKARESLYLTLDRLRGDRKHSLNQCLDKDIEEVELSLAGEGSVANSNRVPDESSSSSDEDDGSEQPPQLPRITHSTPMVSKSPSMIATPFTPQSTMHTRPSPERLDAQMRSLAYSQDALVKMVMERNSDLVETNKAIIEELKRSREMNESLMKKMEEKDKLLEEARATRLPVLPPGVSPGVSPFPSYHAPIPATGFPSMPGSSLPFLTPGGQSINYSQLIPPAASTPPRSLTGFSSSPAVSASALPQVPAALGENYGDMDGDFYNENGDYYGDDDYDTGDDEKPRYQVPDSDLVQDWPFGNVAGQEGKSTITYSPQGGAVPPQRYTPEVYLPMQHGGVVPPPAVPGVPPPVVPGVPLQQRFPRPPIAPGFFSSPTTTPSALISQGSPARTPASVSNLAMPPNAVIGSGSTQPPSVSPVKLGGQTPYQINLPAANKSADASTLRALLQTDTDDPSIISPQASPASPTKFYSGGKFDVSKRGDRKESECSNTSAHDDSYTGPDFKPIIPLPDIVDVVTGEEDEVVLFQNRSKLFRFADNQWKERGLGQIKILHNEENNKVRVLMRRDQVMKICANHMITPDMNIKPMPKNDKALIWFAMDYADEEPQRENFCCRFKTPEIANEFKATFEKAKQLVKDSAGKGTEPTAAPKTPASMAAAPKTPTSPAAAPKTPTSPAALTQKGFGDRFRPKPGTWRCSACYTPNPADKMACMACTTPKPGADKPEEKPAPATTTVSQSGFAFGSKPSGSQGGFSFGTPTTATATTTATGFTFVTTASSSTTSTSGFAFGTPKTTAATTAASTGFASGSPQSTASSVTATTTTTTMTTTTSSSGFTFGGTTSGSSGFAFGTPKSTTTTTATSTAAATAPASSGFKFGGTDSSGFQFGETNADSSVKTEGAFKFTLPNMPTPTKQDDSSSQPGKPSSMEVLSALAQKHAAAEAEKTSTKDVANVFGGFTFSKTPVIKKEEPKEAPKAAEKKEEPKKDEAKPFAGFSFGKPTQPTTTSSPATTSQDTVFGSGMSAVSFADLGTKTSDKAAFQKKEGFKGWSGAGAAVFGGESPSKDDHGHGHFEPEGDFKPVIPLPDLVEVKTGEEDEEKIFGERGRLFRFDKDTNQWKEKGIGEMKIMKHTKQLQFRILMRREQVLKLCANHLISASMKLAPLQSSDRAWCWFASDYSEDEVKHEQLAIKFKTPEIAQDFKAQFEHCQKVLSESESIMKELLESGEPDSTTVPKKTEEAPQKSLAEMFKPAEGSWQCEVCLVRNGPSAPLCVACQTPKPGVADSTSEPKKDEADTGVASQKSLAELFKPAKGSWSCDVCLVRNSASASQCIACTNPKPGGAQPEEVSNTSDSGGTGSFKFGSTLGASLKFASAGDPGKSGFTFGSSDTSKAGSGFVFGGTATTTDSTPKTGFVFGTPKADTTEKPKPSGFVFGGNATPSKESETPKKTGFNFGSAAASNSGFNFTMTTPKQDAAKPASSFGSSTFTFSGVTPSPESKPFRSPQKSPTKIPGSPGGEYYVNHDGEDEHIYFEPVVHLEKVEVKTGEEDETPLFKNRAKLYRFIDKEWKERGVGEMKILLHKNNKSARFLMRRDQILKICCNHSITTAIDLKPMPRTDGKAWIWFATDYSEDEPQQEQYAIRFRSADIASEFKQIVDDVKSGKPKEPKQESEKENIAAKSAQEFSFKTDSPSQGFTFSSKSPFGSPSQASGTSVFGGSPAQQGKSPLAGLTNRSPFAEVKPRVSGVVVEDDEVAVTWERKPTKDQIEAARKYQLPDTFYLYLDKPPCPGCRGCEDGNYSFSTPVQTEEPDVEFLYEELPSKDKVDQAGKFGLPKCFYLYEGKDPCPGCPGCQEQKVSPETVSEQAKAPDSTTDGTASSGFTFGANAGFSFADLAAKAGTTSKPFGSAGTKYPSKPFSWSEAGATLFNSPSKGEGEETNHPEDGPDIHFEPVVPLPDLVEVRTGEEDEEVFYSQRAKLYRFHNNQWKERGIGELKLLKHRETGRFRILMRREQVLKLACNHILSPDMSLKPMATSEQAWCWSAVDYAEGPGTAEKFAVRFKTIALAKQFKERFDAAQKMLNSGPIQEEDISSSTASTTGDKGNAAYSEELNVAGQEGVIKPKQGISTGDRGNAFYTQELDRAAEDTVQASQATTTGGRGNVLYSQELNVAAQDVITPAKASITGEKDIIQAQQASTTGDKGNVMYTKELNVAAEDLIKPAHTFATGGKDVIKKSQAFPTGDRGNILYSQALSGASSHDANNSNSSIQESIQATRATTTGDKGNVLYGQELDAAATEGITASSVSVTGDKGNVLYAKELDTAADSIVPSVSSTTGDKGNPRYLKELDATEESVVPSVGSRTGDKGNLQYSRELDAEEAIQPAHAAGTGGRGNVAYSQELDASAGQDADTSGEVDAEDDDDDDEYEDIKPLFERNATLLYEENGNWKTLGLGTFQVVYDEDVWAGRIQHMKDDDMLCSHVITKELMLKTVPKKKFATWTAIDYATDDPIRRHFKVQFSNDQSVKEFDKIFQESLQLAREADISERPIATMPKEMETPVAFGNVPKADPSAAASAEGASTTPKSESLKDMITSAMGEGGDGASEGKKE